MNYDCYLGCNTYKGFYSMFSELYDPYNGWHLYIIKGGPGTGKSTMLKKTAQTAENFGMDVHRVHCSSDPSSLDAVIIPELKISAADGTSPHIIEPKYPGVTETTVNLGECWDKTELNKYRDDIISFSELNSDEHRKCVRYLAEADKIRSEIFKTVIPYISTAKIKRFITRTVLKYFKPQTKPSYTENILISAVTPDGIKVFDNISKNIDERVVIEDNYGCIAPLITESIANQAEELHYDIIKCRCSSDPSGRTDHVIIPESNLGFFTSNRYHRFEGTSKTIHAERFIESVLFDKRNYINNLLDIYNKNIENAVNSLKKAENYHDILESYYIKAMDYEKINRQSELLINEIFGNVSRETSL